MEQTNNKLEINKNKEDLKLYFFTIQQGTVQIDVTEDFRTVLAYNDTGAIDLVRAGYPTGVPINIKKRAHVDIKKIIDRIDSPAQELKLSIEPLPEREKTARDFVLGLMLVSDQYITSKRDRASLKRIISKIKYETTTTPAAQKDSLKGSACCCAYCV